jgi:protein TonB
MARFKLSREMGIAIAASVAVHAIWLAKDAKASHLRSVEPSEVILETYEAPLPPKLEEPKSEPELKPTANPKPEVMATKSFAKAAVAATALPPAAQAGKTLTAPDDGAGETADFTMVQGSASEYVGGTTSAIGTSTQAVRGAASNLPQMPQAVLGKREALAQTPDLSRSPRPSGADWSCSHLFPNDPDAGDYATVSIVVTVSAEGTPKAVTVLRDPGHGFAAAARACAMSQRYAGGLDRQGNPTTASTPPITVRFTR